jgi:hypothetical protein
MPEDVRNAHKHSSKHREEIMSSSICGCFYCCSTFNPSEIYEWVDLGEVTATCPRCGIDSVIGDKSGYDISVDFLKQMKDYWFSGL